VGRRKEEEKAETAKSMGAEVVHGWGRGRLGGRGRWQRDKERGVRREDMLKEESRAD
jgi:hypothetical protein